MDKININYAAVSHSKYGIETVPVWSGLETFNKHVAAISKQKDWQIYFPMEAVIKFQNPNGTLKDLKLVRINYPIELTL
jgi:hypothetical protein